MQPAPYSTSSYLQRPSLRSRLVAGGLSAAILLVFGWLLFTLGQLVQGRNNPLSRIVAISLPAAGERAKPMEHQVPTPQKATSSAAVQPVPHPQPPVTTPSPQTPVPAFIHLSHDDLAASDIGRINHATAPASGSQTNGTSNGTYGPGLGAGPGGAHLYPAKWYREPTNAEVGPYLPTNLGPDGGWAIIACRTVEHYHVEDCREIDESPPGSGLARGVRRAAWQFLVRPPEVNGQAQVGAWVSIYYKIIPTHRREDAPVQEGDGGN